MESDCLTCRYRGTVPNSRHSSCKHPRVNDIIGDHDALQILLDRLVNNHVVANFYDDLQVEFDRAAIMEGYALFPFNFDPIWLKQCTGYREVG